MHFTIDERISSTCFQLGDWPLCRVFLKNNADYPWFILVPRIADIEDIMQLPSSSQHMLIDEISQLARIIKTQFQPDKLNIGTLGNIVPQLHIHLIARYQQDKLWPHGVWQAAQITTPYNESHLQPLLNQLKKQIDRNNTQVKIR